MVFSRTTDTIQGDRTIRAVIAAKHAGYSNFEVAMDHELQFEVNRRFAVDLGVDAIQTNSIVNWTGMQKAIGWKGIMFPGIGLPEDGCCKKVIDGVAGDGGYILDASALLMDDANLQNVRAMIDFTREYGIYSESSRSSLDNLKPDTRSPNKGIPCPNVHRPPGVCFPWEEKKSSFPPITAHEEHIRKVWENIDRLGYLFCWINLTW